jgi:hypothetical protein
MDRLVRLSDREWRRLAAYVLEGRAQRGRPPKPHRSVVEAILLDACHRVKLITEADHRVGKELLFRLVSMLVKLTRSFETPLAPNKG